MIADGVDLILLLAGAFVGALVSAVCGFGGGMLILPLVVALVGPHAAVPLLTLGLLFSNGTRLLLLRQYIDWKLIWHYIIGGAIGALIGGIVFTQMSATLLSRTIGVMLIAAVIVRRWRVGDVLANRLWVMTPVGAVVGFLSAVWGAVGPFAVPFFLATGLRKERFVATMATGAICIHIVKTIVYSRFDLFPTSLVQTGMAVGALMIAGTWVGKQILTRTTPHVFLILVDVMLVVVGIVFLVR